MVYLDSENIHPPIEEAFTPLLRPYPVKSPMVQEQEEQHFSDGIDGPSKFTNAAVAPAIELIIGHFKL